MDKKVYEFISKQTSDPIVERRTCKRTGEEFAIYQGDIDLLHKISPNIGNTKFELPLPTLSPSARMRRRMMFRNERGLYHRTSFLSGKKIISLYHPDIIPNVVAWEEIYTDQYRASDWAQTYDATKRFWTQYEEIWKNIPRPGVININNTNGEYNAFCSDNKNIYLCADTMRCEDALYCTTIKHITNGADLLNVWNGDYVVECVSSHDLTKCFQVWYSESCYDCAYLATCKNCTSCFLCTNISDKKNYILNKPASEEEIQQIKSLMKTVAWQAQLQQQFQALRDTQPRPAARIVNAEKSTGSVLSNSQNAFLCFDSHDLQDCRYCHVGEFNSDAMDCTIFNPDATQVYEQVCGGRLQKSVCDTVCRQSSDTFCSEFVMNCDHMLGCINMKDSSYCIFNKQYSKEEREALAQESIHKLETQGSWGEFFASSFSPFPYNDTVANDYFPIHTLVHTDGTKEIIDEQGTGVVALLENTFIAKAELDLGGEQKISIHRRTQDYEINIPQQAKVIPASELPKSIDEVQDDICSCVILCEKTGRPYQITRTELKIYRALGINLPRLHYSIRHTQRIRRRPGKEFCLRTCSETGEEILSLYPADTTYPVYSQKVFEKLLYG